MRDPIADYEEREPEEGIAPPQSQVQSPRPKGVVSDPEETFEPWADVGSEPKPPSPPVLRGGSAAAYRQNIVALEKYKTALDEHTERLAKHRHNAEARRISRETGAQFISDEQGVARPVIDPLTGQHVHTPRKGEVQYGRSGPYRIDRDRGGNLSVADPDADTKIGPHPSDPSDPHIYKQNKHQPWQAIDPEEGLRSGDRRVAVESARFLHGRELVGISQEKGDIDLALGDPSRPRALTPEKRSELERRRESFSAETPEPGEVRGMFGGVNHAATDQKRKEWEESEAARKASLEEIEATLANDDEITRMRQRKHELSVREKELKDEGVGGYWKRRIREQAEKAESEEEGIQSLNDRAKEIQDRGKTFEERAAALDERGNKGVSAEEAATLAAERLALQREADDINAAAAALQAEATEVQRIREEKRNAQRVEQRAERAEMVGHFPEIAQDIEAINALEDEFEERSKSVAAIEDPAAREIAQAALEKDAEEKLVPVFESFTQKAGEALTTRVTNLLDEVAGPGGAMGFKAQIASIRDSNADPLTKKAAEELIQEEAVDQYIRWHNHENIRTGGGWEKRLASTDPNHRAQAAAALEKDPGLQAKIWDGFDRIMTTLGRTLGIVGVLPKALIHAQGWDKDSVLARVAEKLYRTSGDLEKAREHNRDPRLEVDTFVNRHLMPGAAEIAPNLVGMALGPKGNLVWNVGQLYYEAYHQAEQDPTLTEDQRHLAASTYVALGFGPEMLGDWLTFGLGHRAFLPKTVKRDVAGRASHFLQRFETVGRIWDGLPPIVKNIAILGAAGVGEGVTETIQDKMIDTAIEVVKDGNVSRAIREALSDNREVVDTFIIASIAGGGMRMVSGSIENIARSNPEKMEALATKLAGMTSGFNPQHADILSSPEFDSKKYAALYDRGAAIQERLGRLNVKDKQTRAGLFGDLYQVELQKVKMLEDGIAGFVLAQQQQQQGQQQQQAARPKIFPEQLALVEAELQQAGADPATVAAVKIASGRQLEQLSIEEQKAVKPHLQEVNGVQVVGQRILDAAAQASPEVARLIKSGAILGESQVREQVASRAAAAGAPATENVPRGTPPAAEPNLPLGQARQLSEREAKIAETISKFIQSRTGADSESAAAFARHYLRNASRTQRNAPPQVLLNSALQSFNEAGGLKASATIRASVEAQEQMQGDGVTRLFEAAMQTPDAANLDAEGKARLKQSLAELWPKILAWNEAFQKIGFWSDPAGGVAAAGPGKEISLNLAQLVDRVVSEILNQNEQLQEKIIQEEVIHIGTIDAAGRLEAARQGLTPSEVAALTPEELFAYAKQLTSRIWAEVKVKMPEVRAAVETVYGAKEVIKRDDMAGHEFLRMLVQGDLSMDADGNVYDADGNVLTEQANPGLAKQIREIAKNFLKWITGLRSRMAGAGVDPQVAADVEAIRALAVDWVKNLKKQSDQTAAAEYKEAYATTTAQTPAGLRPPGTGEDAGPVDPAVRTDGERGTGEAGQSDGRSDDRAPVAQGTAQDAAEVARLRQRNAELEARERRREAAEQKRRETLAARAEQSARENVANWSKILESVPEDARAGVAAALAKLVPGAATYVLSADGKRLPAQYVAAPIEFPEASHQGEQFEKNPRHLGNTRAYESDEAEQRKVNMGRAAGALNEDILSGASPIADAGPPGFVLAIHPTLKNDDGSPVVVAMVVQGNARQQMIQGSAAADQARLTEAFAAKSGQFGVQQVVEGQSIFRFYGIRDLRQPAARAEFDQLVDNLNPSTGVVQDTPQRAHLDSRKLPLSAFLNVPVSLFGERAKQEMAKLLREHGDKLDLFRVQPIAANPVSAQSYMQNAVLGAAFQNAKLSEIYGDEKIAGDQIFAAIVEQAAPVAIRLRTLGQTQAAESLADALAVIADVIRSRRGKGQPGSIRAAITQAAGQMSDEAMGGASEFSRQIIEALSGRIETTQTADGKTRVQKTKSFDNLAELFRVIDNGVRHWSPEGDMFGAATPIEDVIRAAINVTPGRDASPAGPQAGPVKRDSNPSRLRHLMDKHAEEGLTTAETKERDALLAAEGQAVMPFMREALSSPDLVLTGQSGVPQAAPAPPASQMRLFAAPVKRSPERVRAAQEIAESFQESSTPTPHQGESPHALNPIEGGEVVRPVEIVAMIKPLAMTPRKEKQVRQWIADNGGEIIQEWRGYADAQRISSHYGGAANQPYFPGLLRYFQGKKVLAMRVRLPGHEKIPLMRDQIGPSNIEEGTLRSKLVAAGDWVAGLIGYGGMDNGIHLSDSVEAGRHEVDVWFGTPELQAANPETRAAHIKIWHALSQVTPNVRLSGSNYNGTAAPSKSDDLDYTVITPDGKLDEFVERVMKVLPGAKFDTRNATDPTSGQKYHKLEFEFATGKADIAIVPESAYNSFLHHGAVAYFMPPSWKASYIRAKEQMARLLSEANRFGKESPERNAAKKAYEKTKKDFYRMVRRYFNLDRFSEKPVIGTVEKDSPVDSKYFGERLKNLERTEGGASSAILKKAWSMTPASVRGHLIEWAKAYDWTDVQTTGQSVKITPSQVLPEVAKIADDAGGIALPDPANVESRNVTVVMMPDNVSAMEITGEISQKLAGMGLMEIELGKTGVIPANPVVGIADPSMAGWRHENVLKLKDGSLIIISTAEVQLVRHLSPMARSVETAYLDSYASGKVDTLALVKLRDYFYEGFEANRSATRTSTSSFEAALTKLAGVFGSPHLPSTNSLTPIPGKSEVPQSMTTGAPSSPTPKNAKGEVPTGSRESSSFITPSNTPKATGGQRVFSGPILREEADLFAWAAKAPEVKKYDAALEAEGIATPEAKSEASKQDFGVDLFGNPLTTPPAKRNTKKETTDDRPGIPQDTQRRSDQRRTVQPPAGGGLGDLFQSVSGQRDAELAAPVAGGTGAPVVGNDRPQDDPSGDRPVESGVGRSGVDSGELPLPRGMGRPGGRQPAPGPPSQGRRVAGPGSGVPVERPAKNSAGRNLEIPRGTQIAPRGTTTKLRANLRAIEIIQTLEKEARLATAEEKAELVKFTGWGAMSQAFDDAKSDAIENGEIEWMRDTIERIKGYGNSDIYASQVREQEELIQKLENWQKQWGEAHAQIKTVLTPDEYRDAKHSTINAHYTSPPIISAMWDIVKWFGFQGGNVLEPGAGIGHFFGLMPESLADRSKLFGVELDVYTAKILKTLYPEADIQQTGFQTADIVDGSIDLAISNVPFANVPVNDPALEAMGGPTANLHDYFFGKTLTKLKPGGMLVFITSAFTMDKGNTEIREWLAKRADLVAAYRLPNNTFRDNAGTSVVTDIIILRKKDGKPFEHAQSWTGLADATTRDGGTIRINEYFAAHPKNILGLLADDGSMHGGEKEMTVHGDPALLPEVAIEQDIATLPQGIMGEIEESGPVRNGSATLKMGNIVERDGQFYFQGQEEPDPELNASKNAGRVIRFLAVRDALNRQYDLELSETATDEQIESNRRELNAAYDRFYAAFGYFHSPANALFRDDPDTFRILGAEIEKSINLGTSATRTDVAMQLRKKNKDYEKADIFHKRVLAARTEPTQADSLEDAFGISLGWRGRVDVDFIARLIGKDPALVAKQLVAQEIAVRDPDTGLIMSREQYLSGNVRKKLEIARAAGPDYKRNVAMLEAVQPQRIGIEDIRFRVGSTWIPAEIYNEFLESLGVRGYKFTYVSDHGKSEWHMERTKRAYKYGVDYRDFETPSAPVEAIFDRLLNQKAITINKSKEDGGGIDHAATAAAKERSIALNERFIQWVRGDAETSQAVEDTYNSDVNAHVQRTYDGQFLTLPWASKDFDIYPDKKNTIWRAIQEGFGLIAHGVGGGKTIIGSAIALEMRRLGMARKPMIVVHNSTLEGFAKEISRMAPSARVLVGRKDELGGAKRKEFLMRIAAGDWDAVVIAHSTFGLIADDPAVEIQHARKLVDEALDTLSNSGYDSFQTAKADKRKSPTVKALVKLIESLETQIELASARETDSDLLTFQQLGIDALVVDEVHKFKKIPFTTQLEAKGIDGSMSKRAYALFMRARYIQARMGGKNVFSMTGTPVTNTLGEIWNMLRLVAPNMLAEYNVELFDQFVSTFAQVENNPEMTVRGDFKPVDRLSAFTNIPEWNTFLRMAADVKLGDDLVVKNRPEIKGGKPQLTAIKRTKGVAAWVRYIRGILDAYAALDPQAIKENPSLQAVPVQAYMASRAAAIDIRLIEPRAKDEAGSKVNTMLERALEIYRETSSYNGTQVIFADSFNQQKIDLFDEVAQSDLGIEIDPSKPADATFSLYEDIRDKLIAAGVPESEIILGTDKRLADDKKKQAVFEAVNRGEIRFIIGSTERLGTGVNMQERMAAAHHLDAPWTPADLEQRDGRVYRQGNIHAEMGIPIEINRFGMIDTLDAAIWQKLETKQKFTYAALSGKVTGRDLAEDNAGLTYEEQRAVLSGIWGFRRWEIENRLRELDLSRRNHSDSATRREAEIAAARRRIEAHLEAARETDGEIAKMRQLGEKVAADGVALTIDGQSFATKTAAQEALKQLFESAKPKLEFGGEKKFITRDIASIAVHGVPVFLQGQGDMQEAGGKAEFELMGSPDGVGFGTVVSPATLYSRLEELAETAANISAARENNLARLRQVAGMKGRTPWEHHAEYDRLQGELVEVQRRYEQELREKAAEEEGESRPQSGPVLRRDAAYLAAVEAGDMETAHRMVDEAALAAMPENDFFQIAGKAWRMQHATTEDWSVFRVPTDTEIGWIGHSGAAIWLSPEGSEVRSSKRPPKDGWIVKKLFPFARKVLYVSTPDQARAARDRYAEMLPFFIESSVVAKLQADGYDGILWTESKDSSPPEVVVFSPNQIKSADPVTYYPAGHPKAGKPIPLSERFQPDNPSVLHSSPILRESPVDRLDPRAYQEATGRKLDELGIPENHPKRKDAEAFYASLAEPVKESGVVYRQIDLFGRPERETAGIRGAKNTQGVDTAVAPRDRGRREAPRRAGRRLSAEEALKSIREENAQAFIEGLQGDATARLLRERGRVSSILPELVTAPNEIPFDLRGAVIESAEDLFRLLQFVRSPYQESLKVIVVDNVGRVVTSKIVHIGALNETVADPRVIIRDLLDLRETAGKNHDLFISHNHPSGDPAPSSHDRNLQHRLNEVAALLGFNILDHLITNGETFYSMRAAGIVYGSPHMSAPPARPKSFEKALREEPASLHATRKTEAPLAKWEVVPRSMLPQAHEPESIINIAMGWKNDAPDSMHVFYLTTRLTLTGIERIPPEMRDDPKRVAALIAAGAAREGAYAYAVAMPSRMDNPAKKIHAIHSLTKPMAVHAVDFIFEGNQSAKAIGLLEEPTTSSEKTDTTPATLFKSFLPQSEQIAASFANIPGYEADEVRQVARIATLDAAKAFDGSRGAFFPAFATTVVRNRLRGLYRHELLRATAIPRSLDEPMPDGESRRIDHQPGTAALPADLASMGETRASLARMVSDLPARMGAAARGILEGESQVETAQRMNISKQAVSNLQKAAMRRLRGMLGERGVTGTDDMLRVAEDSIATPVSHISSTTNVGPLQKHPKFNWAKYLGNPDAAHEIVRRFYKPEQAADVMRQIDPSRPAFILPVQAKEGKAMNALPFALALRLSEETGLPIWLGVYKTSGQHNTDAPANERSRTQHDWSGELPPSGSQLVFVDDTYTTGQTLKSLEKVVGAPKAIVTISSSRYGKSWTMTPIMEEKLLAKAGITQAEFRDLYGGEPQSILTGAQGQQYLFNGARGRSGLLARFPQKGVGQDLQKTQGTFGRREKPAGPQSGPLKRGGAVPPDVLTGDNYFSAVQVIRPGQPVRFYRGWALDEKMGIAPNKNDSSLEKMDLGPGFYLTDDVDMAEYFSYRENQGDYSRVGEYYVSGKLLRLDIIKANDPALREIVEAIGHNFNQNEWENILRVSDPYRHLHLRAGSKSVLRDVLERLGYHGIVSGGISGTGSSAKQVAMFNTSKIIPTGRNVHELMTKGQGLELDSDSSAREQDAAYLAAVEAGDMETAQRMVDEAAQRRGAYWEHFNGKKSKAFWHYARTADKFNIFKIPAWFSKNKEFVQRLKGLRYQPEDEQKSKPFYLFPRSEKTSHGTKLAIMPHIPGNDLAHSIWKGVTWIEKIPVLDGIIDPDKKYAFHSWTEGIEGILETPAALKALAAEYDILHLKEKGYDTYVVLRPDVIKSADPVTYYPAGHPKAGKPIPLSERFQLDNPSVLYSSPIDPGGEAVADPIDELFRQMEAEGYFADVDAAIARAEAEEAGRRTAGRPDLAHGADNPQVMGVDQIITDRFDPQTHKQWEEAGAKMLEADPEKVRKDVERAGMTGETISPELTKAAETLAARLRRRMVEDGTPESARAFIRFWTAFRATGTAAARELAARRDPQKSPAERHREFLADLISKPTPAQQREIDAAPAESEKTGQIRHLTLQLAEAVKRGDAAAAEATRLRKELADLRAAKTKETLVDEQSALLLAKLAKAGITPADILQDKVALRLRDKNILAAYEALFAAPLGDDAKTARKRAFRMIRENKSFADIAKRTGLDEKEVRQIKNDFIAAMRRDHFAKFLAGAKAEGEWSTDTKPATKEKAEAEFARWLAKLGIVPDARQGKAKFSIENPAHVVRLARAIQAARDPANGLDMAYEWFVMNILSAPTTQMVNITGNLAASALDLTLQRGLESLINLVVRDSKSAQMGEFRHLYKGILPGMARGLKLAIKSWDGEADFFGNTILGTPVELEFFDKAGGRRGAIPGKVGRAVRIPGRGLLFADAWFKSTIAQSEVGAVAYRIAKKEGLKGQAMEKRIALLSMTRNEVIAARLATTRPPAEMVEYFAAKEAERTGEDADAMVADPASLAWELAREQAAYDSALADGWSDIAWKSAVRKATDLTYQESLLTRKNSDKADPAELAQPNPPRQGGNFLEDIASTIQSGRSHNPLLGYFFPFVRTPYNIFRIGLRKSPLGLANYGFQAARGLWSMKDGKPYLQAHPQFVRDTAEQILAWTALALLFGAVEGDDDDDDKPFLITGSMPAKTTKRGERLLGQRAYGGSYVIRVGGRNGLHIDYGRYEPIGVVLGTVADTIRTIKSHGGQAHKMDMLHGYFVDQLRNKTFLQGFAGLMASIEGQGDIQGAGKRAFFTFLVPNIVRSPLRNLDDYTRDSRSAGGAHDAFPSGAFAEKAVTPYGDDILKRNPPIMRIFFRSPLERDETLQQADRLLLRWNQRNPENTWAPQEPGRTVTVDGEKRDIDATTYRRYSILSGRIARDKLRGIVNAHNTRNPTEEDVADIRRAFEEARREARQTIFGS